MPVLQTIINKENYNYQNSIFPKNAEEVTTPVSLKVTGRIPEWLKGNYLRNGPAKHEIGKQQLTHWFDGFALITSFEFDKNGIYYRASFLKSDQFLESNRLHAIKLSGFGQNFGESAPKHISKDGQKVKTANPNINIQMLGNHLIALGETPLPIEFNEKTLQTIGIFDYDDKLKKANSWESAHMKRDPMDGTLYNFYIDYGLFVSDYVFYKIEEGSTTRSLLGRTDVRKPSYMHDFSITKNYIILTAYPLVVNPLDLLNPKYSFIGAHRWEPALGTQVHVFDKKTGKLLKKLLAPAMFAFHHVNAFEEGEERINVYLSTFDDAKIALKIGNDIEPLQLQKMVINLKNSSIDMVSLSKEFYEIPTINNNFVGIENQYFYAIWYNPSHLKQGFGIVKYDLKTNQTQAWVNEGLFPGEPLFVPKPAGQREDDGVVLSIVYDALHQESFLLILDSESMKELARAKLPTSLPQGLHGKFITPGM